MTSPTRFRRTPNLVRTSLYSEMMSSLTSQLKVVCSSQSRRNDALGILDGPPGFESRDASDEYGRIDDASRPTFPTSQQ